MHVYTRTNTTQINMEHFQHTSKILPAPRPPTPSVPPKHDSVFCYHGGVWSTPELQINGIIGYELLFLAFFVVVQHSMRFIHIAVCSSSLVFIA